VSGHIAVELNMARLYLESQQPQEVPFLGKILFPDKVVMFFSQKYEWKALSSRKVNPTREVTVVFQPSLFKVVYLSSWRVYGVRVSGLV